MKVTVAKTPGSRAVSVEIAEGGTVLDALKAADMASSLDQGFEVRVGFEPAELTDVVTNNAIVTLTAKVKGNAPRVVHIAVEGSSLPPATFVLEKVTNSKSIFNDVEIQAYILSAIPEIGSLELDKYNSAIFGMHPDGSWTAVKDRPCNNGTFLTTAPELYCIIHNDSWSVPEVETKELEQTYFGKALAEPESNEEACECEPCEDEACGCDCKCEEEACCCDCECEEEMKDPYFKENFDALGIPKTIQVNVEPEEHTPAVSQLQKVNGLIDELRKAGQKVDCKVGLDITIHIHAD